MSLWQVLLIQVTMSLIVAAITTGIQYFMDRNAQQQQAFRYESNHEPPPQRNLSCPVCGEPLNPLNDRRQLPRCGHRVHNRCLNIFQRQNLGCSFCADDDEVAIAQPSDRSEYGNARDLQRNRDNESSNTENESVLAGITRNLNERTTCGSCDLPLRDERTQLKCGHWWHNDCARPDMREIVKCSHCSPDDSGQQSSSEKKLV